MAWRLLKTLFFIHKVEEQKAEGAKMLALSEVGTRGTKNLLVQINIPLWNLNQPVLAKVIINKQTSWHCSLGNIRCPYLSPSAPTTFTPPSL